MRGGGGVGGLGFNDIRWDQNCAETEESASVQFATQIVYNLLNKFFVIVLFLFFGWGVGVWGGLQIRANLYNFADSFKCVFIQTMPISTFVCSHACVCVCVCVSVCAHVCVRACVCMYTYCVCTQ